MKRLVHRMLRGLKVRVGTRGDRQQAQSEKHVISHGAKRLLTGVLVLAPPHASVAHPNKPRTSPCAGTDTPTHVVPVPQHALYMSSGLDNGARSSFLAAPEMMITRQELSRSLVERLAAAPAMYGHRRTPRRDL